MMKDYIPYATQDINEEDLAAVREVLMSGWLTQGPTVPRFEQAFAQLHGVAHAVAVSNATAGLHIACLALGIGPGKRVWTSPNSFVASANCALYCGAAIDFVDIDPVTRNLSVAALVIKLEQAASAGEVPDLLIPVHFSGLPCDLREMRRLADDYGFQILEDASHATGASYLGSRVGSSWADVSVFSFHAVKIVTTAEGGMVTTQNETIARRLKLLRTHGITRDPDELQSKAPGAWYYEQQSLGFNYRMTDLQAALGLSQLHRLGALHASRIAMADRYDELLAELPLLLPVRRDDRISAWHLYVVEVDAKRTDVSRATVFESLRDAQIGVNVHYIPIHMQPYYKAMGFVLGAFPAAEHYYQQALSLPLFPAMTTVQQQRVVDILRSALAT